METLLWHDLCGTHHILFPQIAAVKNFWVAVRVKKKTGHWKCISSVKNLNPLRHKRVNIASFVVRWSEMNKNSTNLIYANQLKTRICRSIISVIQKQKHNIIQKAEKTWRFGCTFSPKLYNGWAHWIFSKKQKTKKLHDTDPKIIF